MSNSLAAFLITWNRPLIVRNTLEKLLEQSRAPEKILIIDNSDNIETQLGVATSISQRLAYIHVGYNAGPAGAARIGLEKLAKEGYDWIYWGDDDDPPLFEDALEKLLQIPESVKGRNIGIMGTVGHSVNSRTGNLIRTPDHLLAGTKPLPVDSVAGGKCLLVNAEVVRQGILPDPSLFFGFEELDFCLKVKQAGYEVVVSPELFLRTRQQSGMMKYVLPSYVPKDISKLWRQYYSTRNLLIILNRNKLYSAYVYQVLKALGKALYGFRYGWNYGRVNVKMVMMGVVHALIQKMNKVY